MQTRFSKSILPAIIFFMPFASWAGPPFLTDDPEPLLKRHCEFYIAPQILNAIDRLSVVLPGFEFNYGLTNDVMAHVIVPLVLTKPDSQLATFSLGDIELGVKYRFLEETEWLPQIGTFPHLEIPTGDSSKAVGSGAVEAFIPLWFQKTFGP